MASTAAPVPAQAGAPATVWTTAPWAMAASIGMYPSGPHLLCLAPGTRVGARADRRKNTPGRGLPLLRSLRWPRDVVFIGFYLSEDRHFPLEFRVFFSRVAILSLFRRVSRLRQTTLAGFLLCFP